MKIIDTGGNKLGMPLVATGEISATMFQSPTVDATLAIENIVKVLDGEEVPPATYMDMPVVAEKNADEYTAEW